MRELSLDLLPKWRRGGRARQKINHTFGHSIISRMALKSCEPNMEKNSHIISVLSVTATPSSVTITKSTLVVQSVSTANWSTLLFEYHMHAWYDEMIKDVCWNAPARSRFLLMSPLRPGSALSLHLNQWKLAFKSGALSNNSVQQASVAIEHHKEPVCRFPRYLYSKFGSDKTDV